MAVEIKMPHLSQTTNEVHLIRWIVEEGDSVRKGDPICEVETDKVTMEVESFESGTVLKLYTKPDEIVEAGTVIALLGEPGEKIDVLKVKSLEEDTGEIAREVKTKEVERPYRMKETPVLSGVGTKDGISATPMVRNIARKRNIDLTKVRGTGAGGLITKQDLEQYIRSSKEFARLSLSSKKQEIPLSANQLAVARNLIKSKTEIPHFYLKTEVFTDKLLSWRESKSKDGKRVSIYSILIYIAAKALREFKELNGYLKNNKLIVSDRINVCFAVAVGDELYAPVIKNADKKSIQQIDIEVKSLILKAQRGELESETIIGGTFTVSNLGMYPIDEFYAVINYPQVGILAMGMIKKTYFINEDNTISTRTASVLTGSFDHRIVNGAKGAAFLARCKKIMEEEIS